MASVVNRLRWLAAGIRRESAGVRRITALNALAGIAATAASLFFVWCTKHIIDIATGRCPGPMAAPVAMMAAALALQLIMSAAAKRLAAVGQTRFSNSLRGKLFAHLMRAEWTGRERFHSGDAVNRLTGDVATVSSAITSTLPAMAVAAVQLLAAFIFLLALDARMALIVAAIMPAALLTGKLYTRRSHRLTRRIREAESRLQCAMQESLLHKALLSTLLRAETTVREFNDMQTRFYDLTLRRNALTIFTGSAVTAGFMAGYAAAFLWCAFGLKEATVTFGMMTAFLQLVAQVQRPVVDLAGRIPVFVQTSVAMERIGEILALPLEKRNGDLLLPAPAGIRLRDVRFSYPGSGEAVLGGVSCDFAPRTLSVVAGPTGAGKTTLLMLMTGMLAPRSGSVTLYGGDAEAPASPDTRANIVYVPQGNSLLSGTVRSNLLLGRPDATDGDMRRALIDAEAGFVLELPLGLDTPCGEGGHGLSEGQAQRVAIARGLLGRGSILLLDEPTSALDAATEERLLENLKRVAADRTVVIVSHSRRLLEACGVALRL